MTKYHYKRYLNRAFWNSLFAVLSALILVLIVLYGWSGIKAAMDRLMVSGGDVEADAVEQDQLQQLEALRGPDNASEAENRQALDELRADVEDVRVENLEPLRYSE